MLEKPDLPDEAIIACLRGEYGLPIAEVAFLPLGADVNTAVYRAVTDDGTPYFVKLRSGPFDDVTVAIPHLLAQQGVRQLIAPIPTRSGTIWTRLNDYAVVVSPFATGRDGFERHLSDRHWIELGATLKGLHTAAIPPELTGRLPRESYSAHFPDEVRRFQARAEEETFAEPVAARAAALLREQQATISDLVSRAAHLGDQLRERPPECVLCHADIHAFNVLIDDQDVLYVVDWDTMILAPKERDLMFIGAGIGGVWNTPREEALFYQGYGPTEIHPAAIAYYRYQRIIEDIAAFCEQLLLTDEGGGDREQGFRFLASNFLPGETIDTAYRLDRQSWTR